MKTAMKIVTLMLALVMLCGAFAACTKKVDPTPTPTPSGDTEETKLPDIYWDEDFDVLGYTDRTFGIVADSAADAVSSLIVKRNQTIEAKYGITVKQENVAFSGTEYNMYKRIDKEYMTGKTTLELICISGADVHCMVNDENIKLYNLYDSETMPYLDFDASCWNQEANDALSINGKLFFTTGALNLTEKMNAALLMYNRKILDGMTSAKNPVELVRSGDWTMEEMATLVKNATVVNTTTGTTSTYGFTVCDPQTFWYFNAACGTRLIAKDENDAPYFCIGDSGHIQSTLGVIDKALALLINNESSTFYARYSDKFAEAKAKFTDGNALFLGACMDDVNNFKNQDLSFTYGYLPYPKYDSQQKDYYANISYSSGAMLAIPAVVSDPELASFGLQALCENSKEMTNQYVEIQCKLQGTLDDEQYEMLNTALEHPIYDLGALMDWGAIRTWIFVDYNSEYPSIPISKTNNFADFRASLVKYLDRIQELYGNKKVFILSPIPRIMHHEDMIALFGRLRQTIAEEAIARGFTHIDGYTLVPMMTTLYADEVLHPNDNGFSVYAENLIKQIGEYIER